MDPTPKLYHYNAQCLSVHDGDTITVDIDLGLNMVKKKESLRLFGINAPEVNKPESKEAGKKATDFLKGLVLGKPIVIETIKDKQEKYGRLLAKIYVPMSDGSWVYVNETMVSSGNAIKFMDK